MTFDEAYELCRQQVRAQMRETGGIGVELQRNDMIEMEGGHMIPLDWFSELVHEVADRLEAEDAGAKSEGGTHD